MKDLADYIIKQLVNNPDDVSIEETDSSPGEITLVASVNPEDMGIVIGKSGQTIKAIRRILSIRAMNENVRVNLQLTEPEGARQLSADSSQPSDNETSGEKPMEEQSEEKEVAPVEEAAKEEAEEAVEDPAEDEDVQEEKPAKGKKK